MVELDCHSAPNDEVTLGPSAVTRTAKSSKPPIHLNYSNPPLALCNHLLLPCSTKIINNPNHQFLLLHNPHTPTMSQRALTKTSRLVSRTLQTSRIRPAYISILPRLSAATIRPFSICAPRHGITPTDTPAQPASSSGSFAVAELSDSEYHELADEYLETVLTEFEKLQDTRDDLDVEFSV